MIIVSEKEFRNRERHGEAAVSILKIALPRLRLLRTFVGGEGEGGGETRRSREKRAESGREEILLTGILRVPRILES